MDRIKVTFGDVKKTKTLGRFNSGDGIGIGVYAIDCEVTKAEYGKNKEGKVIASEKGNKQVALNCKVNNGKNDTYFNVKYYETDFSPKLKDITPTDKLKKFARVALSNGGEGFGTFRIGNYTKDGKGKSTIEFFGANVNKANKLENGTYVIKRGDEVIEAFEPTKELIPSFKGIFEIISDTEKFINDNYDAEKKTLRFKLYCFENNESIPIIYEDIEADRALKLIMLIKDNENKVCGIRGTVKRYFTISKVVKEKDNEFEATVNDFDIFTAVSVNKKEDKSYEFKILENSGTLVVENEQTTSNTKTDDEITEAKADDFDF